MSIFSVRDKKVVLNTHVLSIPYFKAVVDTYPDCYINALSYVNYMTNPVRGDNPYLELRPSEKEQKIKRDFPGNYDGRDKVIQNAIARMIEDFGDLPEDRLCEAAKMAAENLEQALRGTKVKTISDIKTLADIFPKLEKVMEALSRTREAREAARTTTKNRGNVKTAYDEE